MKHLFHLGRSEHAAGAGLVGGLEKHTGPGDDRPGAGSARKIAERVIVAFGIIYYSMSWTCRGDG